MQLLHSEYHKLGSSAAVVVTFPRLTPRSTTAKIGASHTPRGCRICGGSVIGSGESTPTSRQSHSFISMLMLRWRLLVSISHHLRDDSDSQNISFTIETRRDWCEPDINRNPLFSFISKRVTEAIYVFCVQYLCPATGRTASYSLKCTDSLTATDTVRGSCDRRVSNSTVGWWINSPSLA